MAPPSRLGFSAAHFRDAIEMKAAPAALFLVLGAAALGAVRCDVGEALGYKYDKPEQARAPQVQAQAQATQVRFDSAPQQSAHHHHHQELQQTLPRFDAAADFRAGSQGSGASFGGGQSSFGGSHGSGASFGGSQGSGASFGGSQSSFGGSQGSGASFGASQGSGASFGGGQSSFGGSQGSGASFGGGQSSGSFSSSFGHAQKEPVVRKFYYVYEAPEEQQAQVRQQHTVSAPEKHYKVIFIKAPSYGGGSSVSYRLGPQVEEKTTVYVLVKSPEEQEHDDQLPDIPVPPPSKPEVHFIKYKSHKKVDNVDGISGIQVLEGGPVSEDEINAELVKAGGLKNIAGASGGAVVNRFAAGDSGFGASQGQGAAVGGASFGLSQGQGASVGGASFGLSQGQGASVGGASFGLGQGQGASTGGASFGVSQGHGSSGGGASFGLGQGQGASAGGASFGVSQGHGGASFGGPNEHGYVVELQQGQGTFSAPATSYGTPL